jgi:hypothetical protein
VLGGFASEHDQKGARAEADAEAEAEAGAGSSGGVGGGGGAGRRRQQHSSSVWQAELQDHGDVCGGSGSGGSGGSGSGSGASSGDCMAYGMCASAGHAHCTKRGRPLFEAEGRLLYMG